MVAYVMVCFDTKPLPKPMLTSYWGLGVWALLHSIETQDITTLHIKTDIWHWFTEGMWQFWSILVSCIVCAELQHAGWPFPSFIPTDDICKTLNRVTPRSLHVLSSLTENPSYYGYCLIHNGFYNHAQTTNPTTTNNTLLLMIIKWIRPSIPIMCLSVQSIALFCAPE